MLISKSFIFSKKSILSNIVFVFFLTSNVFSLAQNQSKIDSLLQVLTTDISDSDKVDVYVKIARNYDTSNFEKIKMYGNKAITLAKKSNYIEGTIAALHQIGRVELKQLKGEVAEKLYLNMLDLAYKSNHNKGRAKAYRGLGRANRQMEKIDQALEYFYESLNIYKYLGNKRKQATLYNDIGLVYMLQGNTNKALEFYLLSIKYCKKVDYKEGLATAYMNTGGLHRDIGNFDKAIDYFSRSIELHKINGKKTREASGYNNLGGMFIEKKDYNKALEYFFKSLKINKKYRAPKYKVAATHSRIAGVYRAMADYKVALNYYFKSLKIYEDISMNKRRLSVLYKIGEVYKIQNQLKLAREYINEGIIVAQKYDLLKYIRSGYRQLGLIEKKDENYKKAIEANMLCMQMTDRLYYKEEIKMVTALEAQYRFKKSKDSLQLVMDQELILNAEKKKQGKMNSFVIYVVVGLIFIIGICCFIIYKNIQIKKYQRLRNRISRDLHDEIGSTLSSIALYGEIARSSVNKQPKKTTELLNLINSYSSSLIESMNDIVWAIDSQKDTISDLINRMRSVAGEIEDTGKLKVELNYNPEIINRGLDMIQRRNIYLIFKEAINNTIKYSKAKRMQIKLDIKKNVFKLAIKDDGIGFDLDKTLENTESFGGNGLVNMRERAKELGGELAILSTSKQGTTVGLEFKLSHKY